MLTQTRQHTPEERSEVLSLDVIRQRVAAIKRGWTPSEVAARAAEGRARRRKLNKLVGVLDEECFRVHSAEQVHCEV